MSVTSFWKQVITVILANFAFCHPLPPHTTFWCWAFLWIIKVFFTCSLYMKSMATWSLDNVLDLTGCLLGSLQPVIGSWAVSMLCIYQTVSVVLDKAVFLLGTFSWPFYMVGLRSWCDWISVSSEVFSLSNKMSFRPIPLLETLSSFPLLSSGIEPVKKRGMTWENVGVF